MRQGHGGELLTTPPCSHASHPTTAPLVHLHLHLDHYHRRRRRHQPPIPPPPHPTPGLARVQTGDVPPTLNYETPDPECDLNYTPNKAHKIEAPKAVISDNLGFGGHNAAVVFKAYP